FSVAGLGRAEADARHLWPEFLRLIEDGRPAVVFGEQVASKDGRRWLARVRADLEALDYAVGAADLCAAGVGPPHIRQRLYFVAHARGAERPRRIVLRPVARPLFHATDRRHVGDLADPQMPRQIGSEFVAASAAQAAEWARLLGADGHGLLCDLAQPDNDGG